MNTVQDRLRHLREQVLGLSLRELQEAVNAELPEDGRVSLGTVSNYERSGPDGRRAGPRAEFLAALKRAFPALRLSWLLLGEGAPTEPGARAAALAGHDGAAPAGGLAGRLREEHPDLELLSTEASALFVGALARYATGEPGMALEERSVLELAADLRWLLFLPFRLWGFDPRPGYDQFSAYCVAALHALTLAMPAAGGGDPADAYADAPNRRLRASLEVGFSEENGA